MELIGSLPSRGLFRKSGEFLKSELVISLIAHRYFYEDPRVTSPFTSVTSHASYEHKHHKWLHPLKYYIGMPLPLVYLPLKGKNKQNKTVGGESSSLNENC